MLYEPTIIFSFHVAMYPTFNKLTLMSLDIVRLILAIPGVIVGTAFVSKYKKLTLFKLLSTGKLNGS